MQRNSTLRRAKPLERRKPLRAKRPFWARSKSPKKHKAYVETKPKPQMRKVSRALEKRVRTEYNPAVRAYLALPGNEYCHICIAWSTGMTREEILAAIEKHLKNKLRLSIEHLWTQFQLSGAVLTPATENHHVFGRTGARLLSDSRGFCASCRGCRERPHQNAARARDLGLVAKPQHWNSWDALDRLNGLALAA